MCQQMNEITIKTWETILYNRDNTFLNLFIIAGTLLLCWRLWAAGHKTAQRVAAALGSVAFMGLLAVGVWQLWS